MATTTGPEGAQQVSDADIPFMQKLLDNPMVLLLLGVVIPTVSYTIWGIMEVISIPIAD